MDNPKICIHGVDGQEMDKYTADIELSNMCRNVYVARLKAAELVRKKLLDAPVTENSDDTGSNPGENANRNHRKTSIDQAMAILKREMSTLIDQDLTLMRQLLTLNEQIEELKWRRRYCSSSYSRGSLASSFNLGSSAGTLSDAELDSSGGADRFVPRKYPTPSSLSVWRDGEFRSNSVDVLSPGFAGLSLTDRHSSSVPRVDNVPKSNSLPPKGRQEEYLFQHTHGYDSDRSATPTGSATQLNVQMKEKNNNNDVMEDAECKIYHGEQQSFDSGIHEPDLVFDIEMNNVTETTKL